jgi:hypothetical protein
MCYSGASTSRLRAFVVRPLPRNFAGVLPLYRVMNE